MYRAKGGWWTLWRMLAATTLACAGGDETPAKDTPPPEAPPASGASPGAAPRWTWSRGAGVLFAIRGNGSDLARVVATDWSHDQILDTMSLADVPGADVPLDLIEGGEVVGTTRLSELRVDSTCAGWPAARLIGTTLPWRVAFQSGLVDGVAFDSLPALSARDSARITTLAARTASRLPADTAVAFRGRPFIVRQANRFDAEGGRVTLVETVRLVPQEANPQHEQIVMIIEERSTGEEPQPVWHVRAMGLEESLSSIELLAALRVKSTGRLALLLRREHENGFVLQWIERAASGRWTIRWQSALDSC